MANPLAVPITVQYSTRNGTAVEPGDYTLASGTLTFANGDLSKDVTVQVVGDEVVEPDETFFVEIFNAVNGFIDSGNGEGTGTILNDDAGLTWSVSPGGGGTVDRSPVGTDATTPSASGMSVYPLDTMVSVTATPAAGFTFVNWTGSVADVNLAATTVLLDVDRSITANFAASGPDRTLTWGVTGTGTVSRGPAGSNTTTPSASGTSDYTDGTLVTVTANPGVGWFFVDWTGPVADVNSATTTVLLDVDRSITANFVAAAPSRTLTWSITGTGTVSRSPVGSNGTTPSTGGTSDYTDLTNVTVTANPGAGFIFVNWTGPVVDANSAMTTILMDSNKTIAANFAAIRTLTWSVMGTGTVSRSPVGSNATTPSAGGTSDYPDATSVTVTAIPAAGFIFVNWSGPVVAPSSATTSVLMDANKSITANFVAIRILTWSITGTGTVSRIPVGSNATDPSTGGTSDYNDGTTVTVTASPASGFVFVDWTGPVSTPTSAVTSVFMDAAKTITANFASASLSVVPATEYTPSGPVGGPFTPPTMGIVCLLV